MDCPSFLSDVLAHLSSGSSGDGGSGGLGGGGGGAVSDEWAEYRKKLEAYRLAQSRTTLYAAMGNPIDDLHLGLDLAGNIPVFGELFDGMNGLLYAGRGQKVNAAASFSAMAPIVGNGLKYGIKGIAKTGPDAIKVFRAVDQAELASIKNTGKFLIKNGGTEAKYFANTLENAHAFGKQLYPDGHTIVEGIIYKSNNPMKYWSPNTDGIGAFIFNQKILKAVKPIIP